MGCLDGMFNLDVICHISNIYTTYICILFFFFFFFNLSTFNLCRWTSTSRQHAI
jgi:hypothetical protein